MKLFMIVTLCMVSTAYSMNPDQFSAEIKRINELTISDSKKGRLIERAFAQADAYNSRVSAQRRARSMPRLFGVTVGLVVEATENDK